MISVIIPNFNRKDSLERAIKSILEQTYSNIEIIIVDDASTKDVYSDMSILGDPHVSIHYLKKNVGSSYARNYGVTKSNFPYIAFLDSDDEWFNDNLKVKLNLLKKNNFDGIYGGAIKKYDSSIIDTPPVRPILPDEDSVNYILSGALRAQTSTYLIRKDAYQTIKFDTELKIHTDYDFFIRFADQYNWGTIVEPKVIINISNDSISNFHSKHQESSILFLSRYLNRIDTKLLLFYLTRKLAVCQRDEYQDYKTKLRQLVHQDIESSTKIFLLNSLLTLPYSMTKLLNTILSILVNLVRMVRK